MSFFNRKTAANVRNFFNLHSYLKAPELKLTTPKDLRSSKDRMNLLLTMRDLRYWIAQNAEHSSRAEMHWAQIEHLNREIHYMQFRSFVRRSGAFLIAFFLILYFAPEHYFRGAPGAFDRPIISQQSGGMSIIKDGEIPRYTSADMPELIGF